MNDLISRQKAIDALGEKPIGDTDWDLGCQNQWEWDTEILRTLSSAEPERTVKAKWYPYLTILADGNCECGENVCHDWKYCPACGGRLEWE